jgi:uncharacterized protein (TIGR03437 family)
LHAYDATDLTHQLYQGSTGSYVKFSTPTIANGKVYVGTLDSVVAFGLQGQATGGVLSVVNAGSFQPGPVAPGAIVSLFGSNLATSAAASSAPWPKVISGTSVFVNGVPAPLGYVSPTQINAQIPYETNVGSATITVIAGGHVLPPKQITVQASAPSLFVDSQNHAIAQNQDGTANGADHPALPGTLLTVYLTGQGALTTPIADGAAAPAGSPIGPQELVTATVGGQSVGVASSRMTPGVVGVLEVTIAVPPSLNPGDNQLTITIRGAISNTATVTLGVN